MKVYSPASKKGRKRAGHDVHHKTADVGRDSARHTAKALKHAARQQGAEEGREIKDE